MAGLDEVNKKGSDDKYACLLIGRTMQCIGRTKCIYVECIHKKTDQDNLSWGALIPLSWEAWRTQGFFFCCGMSSLDAEHKRWECGTLFRLWLQVSLDANQLLLGVFCLAIHQANVPLNQQLMSQTHTVCSFTMGHFPAPTEWRKWEEMMRRKKIQRDRLKREENRERKATRSKMISVRWHSECYRRNGNTLKPVLTITCAHSSWCCRNASCNMTSVTWVTIEWKTHAMATTTHKNDDRVEAANKAMSLM